MRISQLLFRRSFLLNRFSSLTLIRQMSLENLGNKIFISRERDAETFQVHFKFKNHLTNAERPFNFNRKLDEPVETFLGRVKASVEKVVTKSQKKKIKKTNNPQIKENFNAEVNVELLRGNEKIPSNEKCVDIFFNEKPTENLILKIIETEYSILVNVPWVTHLALPSCAFSGFPVYPKSLVLLHCEKETSELIWYRSEDFGKTWIPISKGFIYTPTTEDVGHLLEFECRPGNGVLQGLPARKNIGRAVEKGPENCPFIERHKYTTDETPSGSFRVLSYNILADLYAETDAAKTELFAYCKPYALMLDYRKPIYLKEILGYKADIICLQEVDLKVFEYDLRLILGLANYEGVMNQKAERVAEGVATFYSKKKFKLLDQFTLVFGEAITEDPIFADLWEKVKQNESLQKRFTQRTTTLQVLVLECFESPNEILVVGNTHLYFHPDADHIRLLQGAMALRFIGNIADSVKSKETNKNVSFIFCGDFNSTPDSGIYQYMVNKHISPDYIDWRSNEVEKVTDLELKHNLSIQSACGTPEFTNYTKGFSGCLDYIYYLDNRLSVTKTVPFPSEETLKQHVGLPSVVFPSDHLAVIADFKWKHF